MSAIPLLPKLLCPFSLMLFVSLVAITGCRGQADTANGVQFSMTVAPSPAATGNAEIAIKLADANGAPITGATVDVEGNMSHAGMTPVRVKTRETGGGTYVTDGFRFTMGGDWVVNVTATLADGKRATRSLPVNGVRG